MNNGNEWQVEHTDTFAGEANYGWLNRYTIPEEENGKRLSRLAIIRRAKSLCGLTGYRCSVSRMGEGWEIRPSGMCQVIFVF